MNARDLEAEFASRGVPYSGGLLLLSPDDAVALVQRARTEQLPILGIDAMFVRPGETLSPLEHIADYSGAVERGDGCWVAAEKFIEERRTTGLVFEVTLGKTLVRAV